nr:MAG TPA: hypothetical protein [Caudoviricetes sp.]DAP02914.1 MAG TPA: hypothetical protein [Caudoviricetes sp.]DAT59788.1 MAG TPA: hypothetical protein [Caudoviricetes sp.]DAT73099.1 MAG TPA: hypothetical protein [Caudoviricetes sp.]
MVKIFILFSSLQSVRRYNTDIKCNFTFYIS